MRYIAPVLSCAVLLVALLSMPALANTAQEARRALQTAVTRVLDNIRNPEWVNPATRCPLRRKV